MATSTAKVLAERIGAARILMRLLVYIGLWPIWGLDIQEIGKQKRCQRFLARYYRYLLHLPITFTYNTLMWIEALTQRESIYNLLYISITQVGMMALVLNFWYLERRAWQFMQEISYDNCYALRDYEEVRWWSRQHKFFARLAFLYIGGGCCWLCTALGATLLVNGYSLPYDYWLPFEWHNAQNYWYAYGYELIAMSLTCIGNIIMDLMLCYYLFHIALLYKLVGMRITALQYMCESRAVKELISTIKLHKRVKRVCTKDRTLKTVMRIHERYKAFCTVEDLLPYLFSLVIAKYFFLVNKSVPFVDKNRRLTLECETLVSLPILVQILLSALIMCLSAYRLQNMQISENPGQFLAMLQFTTMLTLQIFLPCYFANEITINSYALTTCVYNSNWEEFSPATRKLMNIYMELLKQPVVIKSGNFFLVGIPVFTKALNNAYSLLAVLLNMNK